jgi:hypothetical protein
MRTTDFFTLLMMETYSFKVRSPAWFMLSIHVDYGDDAVDGKVRCTASFGEANFCSRNNRIVEAETQSASVSSRCVIRC